MGKKKKLFLFLRLENININKQWKPIHRETYVKEDYFIINFKYKYSNMQDFFPFLFQRKKTEIDREKSYYKEVKFAEEIQEKGALIC